MLFASRPWLNGTPARQCLTCQAAGTASVSKVEREASSQRGFTPERYRLYLALDHLFLLPKESDIAKRV